MATEKVVCNSVAELLNHLVDAKAAGLHPYSHDDVMTISIGFMSDIGAYKAGLKLWKEMAADDLDLQTVLIKLGLTLRDVKDLIQTPPGRFKIFGIPPDIDMSGDFIMGLYRQNGR